MPLEANERPLLTETLSDNKEHKIDLPQDGALRWIHGTLELKGTNTSTAPTFKEDDILNYIESIGIQIGKGGYKFKLPLRTMFLLDEIRKGVKPYKTAPSTTASAVWTGYVDFSIDFAERVLDDNDVSALLQTKNLSSLKLIVKTLDKDAIASANAPTLSDMKLHLDLREYTGDSGGADINDSNAIQMTNIIESIEEVALEASKTEYDSNAQSVDLVAGAGILEQMFIVTDNELKTDDRVTDMKFARAVRTEGFPTGGFIERTFKSLQRRNKIDYALDNILKGTVYINWREKFGSRTGLITRAKSYDLLRLKTDGSVSITQDKIEIYTKFV